MTGRDFVIYMIGFVLGGAAYGIGVWLHDRHRRAREMREQADRAAGFKFIGRFK